jgi:hypothetical protein
MSTAEQITRWRANIPEELWDLPVWLLWRRVPKPNKPGRYDKIPQYANGRQPHGANGSADDRAQLVEFGDALLAYQRGRADGIGVAVLCDIPWWALDPDDCIRTDGALTPLAQRVVDCGSYVERSPSGNGLRAIYAGKAGIQAKNHTAGVEVFDSAGFVTLTGNRRRGDSLLPCPPALLEEILSTVRAGSRSKGTKADNVSFGSDDSRQAEVGTKPDNISFGSNGAAPPANPDAGSDVRLPLALWQRLERPYRDGCDRSAVAFSIALQLHRAGLTAEQAFALMARADCNVLAPALERRGGDIESARVWLWKYCVLPAYQERAHGR